MRIININDNVKVRWRYYFKERCENDIERLISNDEITLQYDFLT